MGQQLTLEQELKNYINDEDKIIAIPSSLIRVKSELSLLERSTEVGYWSRLYVCAQQVSAELFEVLLRDYFKMGKTESEALVNSLKSHSSVVDEFLVNELKILINENRMLRIGLSRGPRGGLKFDSNTFVSNLLQIATIQNKGGRLLIYNKSKGIYEELTFTIVGKITKYLLNRAVAGSWKSTYEKDINEGIIRSIVEISPEDVELQLVCTTNGVLNLATRQFFSHSPKYLLTTQIPVYYDASAICPKFRRFISEITCNDEELAKVIQEAVGNTLISNTKANKAIFFFGCGANGKSVLADLMNHLLGKSNVTSTPLSAFGKQFGIETIIDKMANISGENEVSGKLGTELLKGIISGDVIEVQRKYKTSITYRPTCKLIFLMNTLPDTSDDTDGYYRKILLIPFNRVFKVEEQNVNLKEELLEELPGILNWALEGAYRLMDNNYRFTDSVAVSNLHKNYKANQNPVQEFYKSMLVFEEGSKIYKSDILSAYKAWLDANGISGGETVSSQKFWKLLDNAAKSIHGRELVYLQNQGYYRLQDYNIAVNAVCTNQTNTSFEFIA